MKAAEFFSQIAYPLYTRYQVEPSKELLWAAAVAVHQVADYMAREPSQRAIAKSYSGKLVAYADWTAAWPNWARSRKR